MDSQMVKLWVQSEISKIQYKKDMGFILPVVADAKIEMLRDFYETFELDDVNFKTTYHDQI